MFDSIIRGVGEKFGLGDKAGALISALLALMTNSERGGFTGFLNRFREAGLGDLAGSWISSGSNTPISNEQLESALGENNLRAISEQIGADYKTTVDAAGYALPHLVDDLTPDGEVPTESDLLSRVGGYLTGAGAAAAVPGAVAQTFDRVDAAATSSANLTEHSRGATAAPAAFFEDDDNKSPLSWLLPLGLLGLLVVLGFWFCGKSSEPVATVNVNANKSAANTNTANTNTNSAIKTVDSSFRIEARDGKYTVSGVVPDQATLDKIKAALTAQYGAGNVDFAGLKVDASAKPFASDWWTNFEKMLPNLKDWKSGSLAFAGNAITDANGLPAAALAQINTLFSGWSLPSSMTSANAETPANENRTLTEVSLPDGTKLQAYPNGIEDQLIKFIESNDYKNGTNDSLKDKWFNFDDLNFKFGTTELVPESKRQLDNIVAILKAFPDVKIKIGGYTDKKGNDAANKKLSDDRAKAVKAALEKSGVGAQVPEAEGYGEEFATVAETATDAERAPDRKTSVRLLK